MMVSYPVLVACANQNLSLGSKLNGTAQVPVPHIPKKGKRSYDPLVRSFVIKKRTVIANATDHNHSAAL